MSYRDKGIVDEDRYITIYNQYTRESMSIVVNDICCSVKCNFLDTEYESDDVTGFKLWTICRAFRSNGFPTVLELGYQNYNRCEKCIRSEKKVIERAKL